MNSFSVLQSTYSILLLLLISISTTCAFALMKPIGSKSMLYSSSTDETTMLLPNFDNENEYKQYLEKVSTLPIGFATGVAKGTFISEEAPSMGELPITATVIYLTDGPTDSWAAVFTKNKFPGSPIYVGRSRLASGKPLQAIVINNKVSNVCSGGDGIANAELVCESVAKELNLVDGAESVLPSSTGIIGWKLPAKELSESIIPKAIENLKSNLEHNNALTAAEAIVTTDRYAKVRSKVLKSNGARIVGIAKGAGMIEPNMATMLSYIMTDATIPKNILQDMLSKVVNQSFNSISVDGDESTSDTVALISSNKVGLSSDGDDNQEFYDEFEAALTDICKGLAADIVRNGEGTGHVIKVDIQNFPGPEKDARRLGRHVVNSPLFKCAVSGNDPNTGRLAGAIGSFMGKFYPSDEVCSTLTLTLGGRTIFDQGKFVLEGDVVEKELSDHMKQAQYDEHSNYPPHQKYVEIGVDFGDCGRGENELCDFNEDSITSTATVFGSDLTKEYVVVNADYRS